ncbi:Dps family protein [Paenibacillus herberti]|uniref:DNA starvation/stationary phase protection protein n=1 Tax=Paenibacillus herberti TaxID=1619309 RepID=A0A229NVT5_9BACL|nr:Dps family protein [Paenibacillus herberti]OXM14046.1 DNA starvation/stationary phase protection protein [Paenibacillus herberti]
MTQVKGNVTSSVEDLSAALNLQVANWNVLYVKLQQFHWLVKGPHFFTLHEKFQALYEEAALRVDELAERILAIGGRPISTMRDYLTASSLTEGSGSESAIEMVRAITADYRVLVTELKQAITVAETADDEVTADMLLAIKEGLEKHIWMLDAFTAQ